MKLFLTGTFLLFSATAFSCETLSDCINEASIITGKQYLVNENIKGKLKEPFPSLNKENVEIMISHLLDSNGYSRVPITEDIWKIINARDIRYHALPMLEADLEHRPDFGIANDYKMMRYRMTNPQALSELSRSIRPFISRYGRVIDMKYSGVILVQDTVDNLKRIYEIVKDADREPTKEQLERINREQEQNFKIRWAKARSGKSEE